jgi:hypothetical protein
VANGGGERRGREGKGFDREGDELHGSGGGPSPPQGHQIGGPLFGSGAPTRRPDPYGPYEARSLSGPHFLDSFSL